MLREENYGWKYKARAFGGILEVIAMNDLKTRDKKLVNAWYIACLSHELKKGKILTRTIYDQEFVLFRSQSGQASALPNRCLHRLAKLSEGHVENNCLVCPYHSWSYNIEGEVERVPSEGPEQNCGKRKLKSLPLNEKDGAIWVWMGEGEPNPKNPPWDFPYRKEKGWISYFMITDFQNEVTNLVENFMDVPHTVSVHKGWFRNEALKKVPITTETSNGKVLVTYDQPEDNIGVLIRPLLNPKNEPMFHTDCYVFPNITRVDYRFGENYQYVINSQCTPVSTMNTRVYTYIAYKIKLVGPIIKPFIQFYTRQVIEQDVWIMNVQKENYQKEIDKPRFQSTQADEPHLQIEKLRKLGQEDINSVYQEEKKHQTDIWI